MPARGPSPGREPARPAAVAGTLAAPALRPAWPAVPWRGSAPSALPADDGRHRPEEQHLALDQALQRVRDDVQGGLQQARLGGGRERSGDLFRASAPLEDPGLLTPPTC
ncbi:hypothetical protein ACPA9J_13020 [Pseudomonas aeruginosa]